jgi:diketogulonate reductase-like aldo/keto reductase
MATSKNEPIRRPFGTMPDLVPVIGQGTWLLGDARGRGGEVAALRAGIAAGATHIDTAEYYGAAEDMVGEAIKGLRREELFIVSKVMPSNGSFKGTIRACEATLRKLGTSYLDVYLLHWRGGIPLEETMSALEALVDQGKIRALGVSNFNVSDLEEAESALTSGRIVCNQVLYHLEERAIEHAVLPWCERHGLAVVGYSPFGHGRFPGPRTRGGRVLAEIARAHGASARQVALRFLVRRPALFAIPKAGRPEHAAENAGAGRLRLTDAELARIDQAFPLGPPPRDLPTL